MAKRTESPTITTVSFGGDDFDKVRQLQVGLAAVVDPMVAVDIDLELRRIIAKNSEVATLEETLIECKESTKAAKEAWEKASLELQSMITELGREYPLFDRKDNP
jgi:hypothetical protein